MRVAERNEQRRGQEGADRGKQGANSEHVVGCVK